MRVFLLKSLIVLFAVLLAGFAWLSQNPDSPHLERAQDWPVVGKLAEAFRTTYLGPGEETRQEPAGTETGGIEVIYLDGRGRVVSGPEANGEPLNLTGGEVADEGSAGVPEETRRGGVPAGGTQEGERPLREAERELERQLAAQGFHAVGEDAAGESASSVGGGSDDSGEAAAGGAPADPGSRPLPSPAYIASEWRWFRPGNRILSTPGRGGRVVERLSTMAWLPVIEYQHSWARVVFRGERGWIDTAWEPPYKRKWARRGLLRHRHEPVRSSDWGRYQQARKLLEIGEPEVQVGSYELLTDVRDQDIISRFDRAAEAAEDAYFARYGRLPSGDPGRSALLFAEEATYREYQRLSGSTLAGNVGHAETGILAFYAEGREQDELVRTLIHEIAHLLNDRALARRLPPWLEEGIATDLGSVWMESSPVSTGRVDLAIQSAESRFLLLGEILEQGGFPTVQTLLSMSYEVFHREPRIQSYAYAHSLALVRYLLDARDGRHADGFREFLHQVASGYGAAPELLYEELGVGPEELERDFQNWLRGEVERIREEMERRVRASYRTGAR